MADVNSNIVINLDSSAALAQLRKLQAGLSKFHQTLAQGNLAAANAQKGLNASLIQSINATGKFAASQVKVATSTQAFTTALEKNKLSLKEYFRYSAAAATANTKLLSRAFANEREILNRARRDRVKALQAQYIQLAKANGGFVDALKVMPKTLMMANGRFTELGTRIQYAAQRQQFLNQLLRQGSTQLLNFGKNTQWAGRQLMVGLTMPLAMLGGYAAKSFKEVEEVLVKFKRVYGDAFTNEAEINAAADNIQRLASEYTKYGLAIKDTIDMAATAAAAGFTGGALEAQVRESTRLAVLGQVEQQQALETTISLQNAFGLAAEDLASKINFLNAVENQTVLSIEDLTIAIPKAAPIVKQLGGNVEDLAFFLTAMKEGGINASEGANALKSGLASLINPTEKASAMLADMGINIKGIVEANAGDLKGTVVGFARALDTLDPLNRARAIEQLFGKFQFSRLSTLFQNVTKDGTQASRAFQLAGSSVEELAVLSEREMKKIENATGVKFKAALEDFKKTIMPLGQEFLEALTPVVKFFGGLFEKFNNLSDGTKKAVTIITAVVAGLGPIFLMTFGLLANGLANLIKLFAVIRGGMAKLNGQSKVLGAGFDYVTQQELENVASSNALHATHQRLIEVFNIERVAVQQLGAAYVQASSQARALAQASPGLFASPGAAAAVSKLPRTAGPVRKYADGVLTVPGPKGAGDIQPAMLSPGEAVIPADVTAKNKGFISAMMAGKIPGYVKGRLPVTPPYHAKPNEQQSGAQFIGMPRSFEKVKQSREIADKIAQDVAKSQFGKVKPTDFGTLLQPSSGRSFPIPNVGGIYRKPNGEVVFVKPTINEQTALAEQRATIIARNVHGLDAPKQTIRTMMDPTDPTGKRKLIVLESPYNPKFGQPTDKFTKPQAIKQLVASLLRGDKDLSKANVFGNTVADVGAAGIFNRASGFRDIQTSLPSMKDQAMINLLGVRGGARKDFAVNTSDIAAKMSPKEYNDAIVKEINKILPRLKETVSKFKLTPVERVAYENMIARAEAGAKANWASFQPIHAAAASKVKNYESGPGTMDFDERAARISQMEKQKLLMWADNEIEKSNLSPELKQRWRNSSRYTFASKLENRVMYDPNSNTWWTLDKKGNKLGAESSQRDRLEERFKYRYGLAPDPVTGKYVSSNLFKVDKWLSNITRGGQSKRGADIGSRNPKAKKAWEQIKQQARLDGLGKNDKSRQKYLRFIASMTDNQGKPTLLAQELQSKDPTVRRAAIAKIDKMFTIHAAHVQAVKVADSLDAAISGKFKPANSTDKYHIGKVGPDFGVVNEYIKTTKSTDKTRFEKILEWNKKSGDPLGIGEGTKYKDAVRTIMQQGNHPFTPENQRHVKNLAELEIAARDRIPKNSTEFDKVFGKGSSAYGYDNAKLVNKILGDRIADSGWYRRMQNRNMFLNFEDVDDQGRPLRGKGIITVDKAEYYWDNKKGKFIPFTGQNTIPLQPGSVVKKGTETRTPNTSKTGGGPVATKQQVAIRRDMGDPQFRGTGQAEGRYLRMQRERELERQGKTQKEISAALKEDEKNQRKLTKHKAREVQRAEATARKEATAAQRAEVAAKDQAFRARQAAAAAAMKLKVEQDHIKALQMNKAIDDKKLRQQKLAARQEKVGRYSGGAAMALGTAGMGMMMTGNTGAGMGLMGASAVAGMAPMLSNPYVAAGVAVTALAASFWIADKNAKKQAESTSKLIDATTATTEKMKKIGELTNKVGASEIMQRRRMQQNSGRYTTGFERGTQQFGTTFLESEVGKNVFAGFKESLTKFGMETSAKQMAVQLAGYVSDGIMSAEQAHSIAESIGLNLKNTRLGANISGQLLDLIGPEGQDLLTNPLSVRVGLVQEQRDVAKARTGMLATDIDNYDLGPGSFASNFSKSIIPGVGPMIAIGSFLRQSDNPLMKKAGEVMAPGFLSYSAGEMFGTTKGETMASASAAYGAQNLEFNQAQIDSLTLQYDKQIDILEKQKASATTLSQQEKIQESIDKLQTKRDRQVGKLRKVNGDILNDQVEAYKVASKRAAVEDAFFDSLKDQVRTKWEGDPMADAFLKSSADLESKELEVKIDTIVASGQMSPMAATSLMNMFAGKEKQLNKVLDTAVKFKDPGKFTEVINFFGGMKDKKIARKNVKMLVNLAQKDPEKAERLTSAINLLQKMDGKEVDIEAYFEGDDAETKLAELSEKLEEVESYDGELTLSALIEVKELGGVNLDALLEDWEKYDNLPDETKKTVIQQYVTLYETISEDAVNAEIAKRIKAAGGAGTVADYYATEAGREAVRKDLARKKVMQKTRQEIASQKAAAAEAEKDAAAETERSLVEPLLRRLKNVRLAAINAAGGFKELFRVIGDGKNAIKDTFDGMETQLLKAGANEQFIDFLTGLSQEELDTFGKVAKKAGIDPNTGKKKKGIRAGQFVLSEKGLAYQEGADEAVIGGFNVAQEKTLKNLNEQFIVTNKLKALGFTNSQIQEVLADSAYTTAIATEKISDEEFKINNALVKQTDLRTKINDLIDRGARQDQINKEKERIPEAKTFLAGLGLTEKEISIGINDENLSSVIAQMDLMKEDAGAAEKAVRGLVDAIRALARGEALQQEEESLLTRVQKGYDAAMQRFDAYRKILENTIQSADGKTFAQLTKQIDASNQKMAELNSELAILENDIEVIQKQIDDLLSDFENQEITIDINGEKITGRLKYVLEDLKEQVDDWERSVEVNFQRPIKELQDESSSLSNDLTLMDNIAKDINEKYDDQAKALEEIVKINEEIIRQQEDQLDIAGALSIGDIAAAAKAAQQARAGSAAAFGVTATDALQKSKENELANIRSANGLKREEIEKRIFDINQQIYRLETDPARKQMETDILAAKDAIYYYEEAREDLVRTKVRPLEEAILKIEKDKKDSVMDKLAAEIATNLQLVDQQTKLQGVIDKQVENHRVAGLTREEWDKMLVDAFVMDKLLQEEITKAIEGVQTASTELAGTWKNIAEEYAKITDKEITIEVKYNDPGSPGTGNGGTAGAKGDNQTGCKTGEELYNGKCMPKAEADRLRQEEAQASAAEAKALAAKTEADKLAAEAEAAAAKIELERLEAEAKALAAQGRMLNDAQYEALQAAREQVAKAQADAAVKSAADKAAADKAAADKAAADALAKAKKDAQDEADKYKAENASKGSKTTSTTHTVSAGQSLSSIAAQYGVSVQELREANPKLTTDAKYKNGNILFSGTTLKIPQNKNRGGLIKSLYRPMGGLIPYMNDGGYTKFVPLGSDTVPAMLTPGEFVMSRYAVNSHGIDTMKAMNNGESVGDSVYNYSISVNVQSDADANEIANAVMNQIKRIDGQRVRGTRI